MFNNPLTLVDPTGMFSVRQALGMIIAIVGSIFMPYLAPIFTKLGAAMLIGFVSGAVSTGTIQGGLVGAFSAGMFYGIGSAFGRMAAANGGSLTATQTLGKILAHGVAGGVMSTLQGGKFGSGFLSAGFVELSGPAIGSIKNTAGQVMASAIIGGTASVLSGGKFANGAMTGAFSYAFNHLMHRYIHHIPPVDSSLEGDPNYRPKEKHYSLQDGVSLSSEVEDNVSDIADSYYQETGKSLVVTSGTRTPFQQANAMYTKFDLGGAQEINLYRNRAAATEIYTAYTNGIASGLSRDQIVASMSAVVQRQVDGSIFISKHLMAGAVDIQSKYMTASQKVAFRAAAAPIASTVILETKPPHWHLQF